MVDNDPVDDALDVPDVLEMINTWDPVHRDKRNGKWYFFLETWAHRCGPYDTEADARTALDVYCETELGHYEK